VLENRVAGPHYRTFMRAIPPNVGCCALRVACVAIVLVFARLRVGR
jgi:hypothetical protein